MCITELQVTNRLGVEIDVCPRCRGVWLDRGELDKLAGLGDRYYYTEHVDDDDSRDGYERRHYPPPGSHATRYPKQKSFWKSFFND